MQIDWKHEALDQLEEHWRLRLRPRLEGLTDSEYFWEPVPGCWTLSRRGESSAPTSLGSGEFTMGYASPPHDREPVTTIAWRLAHLVDAFGSPDALHFDAAAAHAEVEYAGTAEGALRQFDEGHDAWIRSVRALGADGLTRRSSVPARRSACCETSTWREARRSREAAHCPELEHVLVFGAWQTTSEPAPTTAT